MPPRCYQTEKLLLLYALCVMSAHSRESQGGHTMYTQAHTYTHKHTHTCPCMPIHLRTHTHTHSHTHTLTHTHKHTHTQTHTHKHTHTHRPHFRLICATVAKTGLIAPPPTLATKHTHTHTQPSPPPPAHHFPFFSCCCRILHIACLVAEMIRQFFRGGEKGGLRQQDNSLCAAARGELLWSWAEIAIKSLSLFNVRLSCLSSVSFC